MTPALLPLNHSGNLSELFLRDWEIILKASWPVKGIDFGFPHYHSQCCHKPAFKALKLAALEMKWESLGLQASLVCRPALQLKRADNPTLVVPWACQGWSSGPGCQKEHIFSEMTVKGEPAHCPRPDKQASLFPWDSLSKAPSRP